MGQCIARRFAKEGAKVAVAGRNEDELNRIVAEIGGQAILCDFSDHDSIKSMVATAKSMDGGLDIAVNATGWGLLKPFLETTDEDLDRMYRLQLRGPFQFLQELVTAFNDNGSFMQISSATASIMFHDHAAYMATKAGTDHLVRTVANEFGGRGLRFNSVSPGVTATPMTASAQEVPGLMEAFAASYPTGRYGTSEDIAAACVFLASDECFMSGENLQVNGGLCLRGNPSKAEIERSVAEHSDGQHLQE